MSLYAQHGYGKSNKIERGLTSNVISGVILSPRDESPARMEEFISSLQTNFDNVQIIFDPQFYASTISPVRDGKLPDYDYYQPGLTRRDLIAPIDLERYVRETINYQVGLNLSRIVSPTVIFNDFRDPWSQIALSLAQESINYHNKLENAPPLLISLVFNENALLNLDGLNEFLDIISILETYGFYILIKSNKTQLSPQIDVQLLENLLYFSYILSTINQYEVIFGYCDFIGIPLHAVGVTVTSCGWFNTLKQFSLSRFQPSTGGRSPRPKYTSENLLNSILVIPELDTIYDVGMLTSVISNTSFDSGIRANPANAPWPPDICCLHHWEVLNRIFTQIEANANISTKLDLVINLLAQAETTYNSLLARGVLFENASGPGHIIQWRRGIINFRHLIGV